MGTLLDGKSVASSIRDNVTREVAAMAKTGNVPSLHVLLVGENPASQIYVGSKAKACEEVGIRSVVHELPETLSQEDLCDMLMKFNHDEDVDGVLVQLPLPSQIDEFAVTTTIDPGKDVDGFHPYNTGLLSIGRETLTPCTPAGIMKLLDHYEIPMAGARAVVIGRSNIVGKPMAALLLKRHATVTVCHSRTRDLPAVAREADILIVAMGKPGIVDETFIKPGATVVDVGVNKLTDSDDVKRFFSTNEKKTRFFERKGYVLIGDVHIDHVRETAGGITPVPGGVGPLTIAMLLHNTVQAAKARRENG